MFLYVFGFLGMICCLNYIDNFDWNIWLYIVVFGVFVIVIGIFF